jgi:prepilin-type N-terminal cleavage/methylation domain-containing protein
MALARSRSSDDAGFSLVEVIVATLVLSVGLIAVAQLFAVSTKGNTSARANTFTVLLAEQKMEQLRALTWGFDTLGLPVSDYTTDTTNVGTLAGCTTSAGGTGTGLSPSPTGTISQNTDGWVDFLDVNGCELGGGANPPDGTIYIRRWSVEPLPTNPNNTLILQVLVTKRTKRGQADAGNVARLPEEARLMSVKTRKSK